MRGYLTYVIGAGVFTHNNKDCSIWINSKGSLSEDSKQFGPSLRAPLFFPSQRSVVSVPSIFSSAKVSIMKPTEESSPERSNPDMETDGVGEHSIQSLNAKSVTNTPPLNSGLNMEEESRKEGINEAYQNCRSPDDSGNVKHANNSESKDRGVNSG